MAKKKSKSKSKDKKPSYMNELVGILLILAAILGIGRYGPVGRVITSFAVFLVGSLYFFFLLFVLAIGVYMVIKKEKFNFFSSKMIGVYLFLIGILVFLHQTYALENMEAGSIISETISNVFDGIERIMSAKIKPGIFNNTLSNTGGGVLGSLFAALFYKLFESDGTTIVIWVLLIAGFMVFTGLSILDILRNTKDKMNEIMPKKKEKEKEKNLSDNIKINDKII